MWLRPCISTSANSCVLGGNNYTFNVVTRFVQFSTEEGPLSEEFVVQYIGVHYYWVNFPTSKNNKKFHYPPPTHLSGHKIWFGVGLGVGLSYLIVVGKLVLKPWGDNYIVDEKV